MEPVTVNAARRVAKTRPKPTKPGEYGSTGAVLTQAGNPPGRNDA